MNDNDNDFFNVVMFEISSTSLPKEHTRYFHIQF